MKNGLIDARFLFAASGFAPCEAVLLEFMPGSSRQSEQLCEALTHSSQFRLVCLLENSKAVLEPAPVFGAVPSFLLPSSHITSRAHVILSAARGTRAERRTCAKD